MKWINLDTTNLPKDYFAENEYIFQWRREGVNNNQWSLHRPSTENISMSLKGKLTIITNLVETTCEYQYCMPEVNVPNLEELAEEYYESDAVGAFGLNNVSEAVRNTINDIEEAIEREVKKAFLAGRESADIPPRGRIE